MIRQSDVAQIRQGADRVSAPTRRGLEPQAGLSCNCPWPTVLSASCCNNIVEHWRPPSDTYACATRSKGRSSQMGYFSLLPSYLALVRCRRRHQASKPPLAKIRSGSPAPATGSSSLAVGLLLSPRYALGDVGFLQGFQILFEPWQQVSNRIGHCLQTHSLRLPQIVECLFAPVYRALRVADPVTDLSQCQFSVIHRGPLNATWVAASPRPRALDDRRCDLRVNECTGLDQPSQHYHHCRQTQNCHCEKYFLVGRHL
jgi:hypothetical protein